MITINKEQIDENPEMWILMRIIRKNHKVPEHILQMLLRIKDVTDVALESRVYQRIKEAGAWLHISYDITATIVDEDENGPVVAFEVQVIRLFDTYKEYETARERDVKESEVRNNHGVDPRMN